MKQPSLLAQPQYPLCKQDFSPNVFHRTMFVAIQKLYNMGCQDISQIELDNVLQTHAASLEIAQDNDYMSFVDTTKELASVENYETYYTAVRKFSLLREMQDNGFDIKEFYDELEDEAEQLGKLDKFTVQDILNKVEMKGVQLRNKYDVKYVRDEIQAGEDTKSLIDSFKQQPSFGAMMQSGYLSTLWNGWSRGHLILRGGPSSSGKSRCSVADLCNVGMKEMWNDDAQDFVPNPNYQSPTLFIATEQDIRTEVEPMFLAAVAEVEYRSIKNGTMTRDEELRVLKAGEIIKDSGLTICSMPNFTSKSLERKIKEQVELNGIEYMVFDYMEIQSELSAEFKAMSAVAPRQDLVLLNLTSDLKRYAEDYSVGILTGCQLNDNWKEARYVDESFLAGSKAMKNKIDNGSIILPTTYLKRDMKVIEPYIHKRGFGANQTKSPNICETIFKGRYSIYGDRRLKLWSYFDRGTFRRKDFFITNDDNQIQSDIHPTKLEEF